MGEPIDEGFSLIELLVVMVIIGILATVAVLAVVGVSDESEDTACDGGARALAVAVEGYLARHGRQTIPATPVGSSDPERYEQTLVAEGLIRGTSPHWNVSETGLLISLGPCAA